MLRISTAPPAVSVGIRAAIDIASFKSLQSIRWSRPLLFGLGERPIGKDRFAVLHAHRLRRRRGRKFLLRRGEGRRIEDRMIDGELAASAEQLESRVPLAGPSKT